MRLRQIEPVDADAIVEMHSRFSERTRYFRYFSPYPRIPPRDLERFTTVDHHDREAIVAESGGDLIAVARYERLGAGADEAEVAFVVEDAHQGRGLGSVMMEHLAARARDEGIVRFVAEVLPQNARMIRTFTEAGYEVARQYADGVVHLTFPIAPTSRSLSVQWRREQRAEARSVSRLLNPRGVLVYGARGDGTGLGAAVLRHLRAGGFPGPIHPVHRRAKRIEGLPAVPEPPVGEADLAVIAVPAPGVAGVIAECAAAGVTGLVVISAGFDDAQRTELVRLVRDRGMRLVGPAGLGIANTAIGLNATLAPALPTPGRVGFFSQSAALGIALLDAAGRRGIGLSTFVSAGDRADVSGNDLLQFWRDDPQTDAVLLYLETFGNPRKFTRIARELTRHKPVVAVAAAARSRGESVAALFASSGVIRVDTVAELFDVGALVASQPLPAGSRLGVVADAEVFGSLAAAAAPAAGLAVTSVRPYSADAVSAALADPAVDAVLVATAPVALLSGLRSGATREDSSSSATGARASGTSASSTTPVAPDAPPLVPDLGDADKPVVVVHPMAIPGGKVPVYPSVEEAVRALGKVAAYAAWRREPAGVFEEKVVDRAAAFQVIGSDDGWTGSTPGIDTRAGDLLAAYGVSVVAGQRVSGEPDDVAAVAEVLGLPVALKVAASPWRHRFDLGAVRLNLATVDEVVRAHAELQDRFGTAVEVVVQRMAPPGVPCVVQVVDDPAFGPVVGFGLGGLATDLLGDLAWCPAPLTDRDAARLLRGPLASPLLHGYRGTPPVDVAALSDLLLRVGQLADDQLRLAFLELNPVLAHERGLSVLHAEAQVGPPASRPDTGPRRL
ncbi:bifunctional acetate--CoA ligase family protein/GNAT family N-acetyltransferase [Virgisporangium ochraceum]|uniref:GNAT family N-acetyltransferase n=1 Tax=Virgisporangium ochraceum TaxID=65505 RepID=A0A8J3ZS58_9ACTN|nr:GNAT family N-acetyltransferase [Virgisporangium ochraceum]GIJ69514.1 GNAT family N-acetyltransferase [Virgisporangium ochraceum]